MTCAGFAHPLHGDSSPQFWCAFSESTLTLKNANFRCRFLAGSARGVFETGLSSFDKVHLSKSSRPIVGELNSVASKCRHKGINYKRTLLLVTANAGATFFGFKHAIDSWGKTKGKFHFKDDWSGDNLAQIDELSHFVWGYKMTQFLFGAYRWAGFSGKQSRIISISQTALILTLVEYPIDAYNPQQGLGVSDLVFDYMGIGMAWVKERSSWLGDFDIKISSKRNILLGNQPLFAQTYEEFDNFVYWLTYRTKLFLPKKILCFGVGYGVTHEGGTARRGLFGGIGLSLPDLVSLFGERLRPPSKFLGIFYPNLSLRF